MVASRNRPKGARYYGPFGLSVLSMSLLPNQIGYQDLRALLARQPEVSQRARAHMLASPFGTIHAATFTFPRPIGTQIPEPPRIRFASANVGDLNVTGSIEQGRPGGVLPLHHPRFDFPSVNRRLKGDLLVARPRDEPPPAGGTRDLTPGRVKTVSFPRPDAGADSGQPPVAMKPAEVAVPGPAFDSAVTEGAPIGTMPAGPGAANLTAEDKTADEAHTIVAALTPKMDAQTASAPPAPRSGPRIATGPGPKSESKRATYTLASVPQPPRSLPASTAELLDPIDDTSQAVRLTRLYFGNNPIGDEVGTIQPWPADEQLVIEAPANDPDFKRPVAAPSTMDEAGFMASLPGWGAEGATVETVAAKGEVTGPGKRPKTPAERLALDAKQRAKAEKCLAEAVYFESRGEPKRGQIAVAQVVMNRVFSGFYPGNVCGTVYQNAHRRLACQFTFACDGIPDVVNEPDMWVQAKEIARDMLDGKLWLPEIGHSTHYHAYWVHPSWVGEMRKLHKIGVHTFYRPRAWGNTVEVPNYKFIPPGQQSDAKGAAEEPKKAKL
jgi:hypothetical protein